MTARATGDVARRERAVDAAKAPTDVSYRLTLAYALPAFGLAGPFFFIQFYLLNFSTDVLLIAPGTIGAILAACRVWDAVSDPAVGYLSDRTYTRFGRRRPWMLVATPFVAIAFVALWSPPGGLSPEALTAWIGLALFAFFTAGTAWGIPYDALGAELSDSADVRTRIFGVRSAFALSGIAAGFVAMQEIANSQDPRSSASTIAGFVAIGMIALLVVPPLAIGERAHSRPVGPKRPLSALRDVFSNPHARRLLAVRFVDMIGTSSQGAVAPYMAIYILKRPDLMGMLPGAYFVALVTSIPIWLALSRRFDRRKVWVASMLGASASYTALFMLHENSVVLAGTLLAAAGFWSGCAGPLGPTFLAAVIDDDERRTGERKEGVYFAAWAFVEKLAGAVVIVVIAAALSVSGFEANVEQGPAAQWAIRSCLSLLPGSMFLIGAIAFRGFALEERAT